MRLIFTSSAHPTNSLTLFWKNATWLWIKNNFILKNSLLNYYWFQLSMVELTAPFKKIASILDWIMSHTINLLNQRQSFVGLPPVGHSRLSVSRYCLFFCIPSVLIRILTSTKSSLCITNRFTIKNFRHSHSIV